MGHLFALHASTLNLISSIAYGSLSLSRRDPSRQNQENALPDHCWMWPRKEKESVRAQNELKMRLGKSLKITGRLLNIKQAGLGNI